MPNHFNVLVQAAPYGTIIQRKGEAICTIKNTSLSANVYLSSDQSPNISGTSFTTLRPLGTVTLTGEVDTYGMTAAAPIVVEVTPAIQVVPAPSDIAAQIALQGINVNVSSNVDWINVTAFGADPTGVSPSGAIINSTIANNPNKDIYIPSGTYLLEVGLVPAPLVANNGQQIFGNGLDTILKPQASANFDVFANPEPASAGAGTFEQFVRYFCSIHDLQIDCSNMTGTVAGKGNGIHLYGCRYWQLYNLYIHNCPNWAILGDGDNTAPGFNFGYSNKIFNNIFDLNNANVRAINSEAYNIRENEFKWAGANCAAAQPAFAPQDTTSMHLRLDGGYMYVAGNVFGKGGSYTTEAIRLSNNGTCRIIGNRFDGVRYQAITINAPNHLIIGNQFSSPSSTGLGIGLQIGSNNNSIIGNEWDSESLGLTYTYAIGESGGPFTGNLVVGNIILPGTTGSVNFNAASIPLLSDNTNTNPISHALTTPSNSWTIVGHVSYSLIGNGLLLLSINNLSPGTTTDGTIIFSSANGLPVGYRPTFGKRCACYSGQINGTESPALLVNSDGSISCFGVGAGSTRVDLECVVPISL